MLFAYNEELCVGILVAAYLTSVLEIAYDMRSMLGAFLYLEGRSV